tara:strand:- start:1442 stop:1831 length:390 start_codon:yes stop_codon:yes gene_type:complete
MSSFANAVLMGRLGRDPELKTVGNGTSLCTFSIAVNTGFGEREVTTWYNVSIFGKRGETAAQYLAKGGAVIVSGEISNRPYKTKDGEQRYSLDVNANDWSFAGAKGDNQAPAPAAVPEPVSVVSGDIPF